MEKKEEKIPKTELEEKKEKKGRKKKTVEKKVDEKKEEKVEIKLPPSVKVKPVKVIIKKPLSRPAKVWKDRIKNMGMTPKEYNERYPNNSNSLIIQEIIDNEK